MFYSHFYNLIFSVLQNGVIWEMMRMFTYFLGIWELFVYKHIADCENIFVSISPLPKLCSCTLWLLKNWAWVSCFKSTVWFARKGPSSHSSWPWWLQQTLLRPGASPAQEALCGGARFKDPLVVFTFPWRNWTVIIFFPCIHVSDRA